MSFLGGFAKALAMVGVSDEALQQENAELRRQVDDWRRQYEGLHRAYDELNGRHQALSKSNSETLAWHSGLRDRVQKLENENSRLRDQVCVLEGDNNELREQVEELQKKSTDLRAHVQNFHEKEEKLHGRIQDLTAENSRLKAANDELVRQLEVAEAEETIEPSEAQPEDEAVKKEKLLAMKLSDLGLNIRTYNVLNNALSEPGCSHSLTVGNICILSASELLDHVKNFGERCLNDLYYHLGLMGLELAPEENGADEVRIRRILEPSRARLTALDDMDLSVRTKNAARLAGLRTMYDVLFRTRSWRRSEDDLRKLMENDQCADELLHAARIFVS